jgi:hypothetical protein
LWGWEVRGGAVIMVAMQRRRTQQRTQVSLQLHTATVTATATAKAAAAATATALHNDGLSGDHKGGRSHSNGLVTDTSKTVAMAIATAAYSYSGCHSYGRSISRSESHSNVLRDVQGRQPSQRRPGDGRNPSSSNGRSDSCHIATVTATATATASAAASATATSAAATVGTTTRTAAR